MLQCLPDAPSPSLQKNMASRASIARALAAKYGVAWNRGHGPDIRTEDIIINIENVRTLDTACGRLRGFRGPVYVACANDQDIADAEYWTEGSTVGIMDARGKILKKSTRGYWP